MQDYEIFDKSFIVFDFFCLQGEVEINRATLNFILYMLKYHSMFGHFVSSPLCEVFYK